MDGRQGIKEVSARFHISARTLRYYEEIGLLQSHRRGSRYREYDTAQLRRLETILLLRRLSFGLRDITDVLLEDGQGFREALKRKIAESNGQLLEVREVNQLLKSLLSELETRPLSGLQAADILKEFTYLTKKTERTIPMSLPFEEKNRVAIGVDIVAEAVDEKAGDLIEKIKALRAELEARGRALPPIRVYDSGDLEGSQALVVMNGAEVWRKNYSSAEVHLCSAEIVQAIAGATERERA